MPIYGEAPKVHNISRIMVCVDSLAYSEPIGCLISPYRSAPAPFTGIISMITLADEFFNAVGFPQAYNRDRSFQALQKPVSPSPAPAIVAYMDEEAFAAQSGQLATFIILVQFRQNSTWQGTVTWREQHREQKFHSTLELVKLMDSALSGGGSAPGWA